MEKRRVAKRFFISHASVDKPLAIQLKAGLEGDAWVDLHEIDIGDILLEEISAGIENATDFVLLWSAASSVSAWVKFELHMAFIRWLEDNAVAIRIVCLDDTAVPLYFRPFLQARGKLETQAIVKALSGSTPPPRPRRPFYNRHSEIDLVEKALYNRSTVAVFVCGLPGVGKRSLAREALARLTSGIGASLSIKVSAGVADPELNLLVAAELKHDPAPEGSSVEDIVAHTRDLLRIFAREGGIWVFEDSEHWLNDDGTLGRICQYVIEALKDVIGPGGLILFTSRRRPVLPAGNESIDSFFLKGLAKEYAVPLLRGQGAVAGEEALEMTVAELEGHPLSLEVVAPRLPLTALELRQQRLSIATDMIKPGEISAQTWRALEVLALVDGPVAGEDLSRFLSLSSDRFQEAVAEAVQYSLVMYSDTGSLSLHPLLRDYFLRSFRTQSDHQARTSELADLLSGRFARLTPDDPLYVPALLSTVKVLGLAGRFEEARGLRQGLVGTLYATALELYQEKRYEEALGYLSEARTGSEEHDVEVDRLRVKTLAYLGRLKEARQLGDRLLLQFPSSPAVLRDRGRVEFIAREWKAAISFFEKAIPLRRNPAQLWSDIAQARVRLEDWTGAVAAARTAIGKGGDTPWTLVLLSEALEHLGEFPEAEGVMLQAVNREPRNPAYRHRLGRIAQLTGNRELAMSEFRAGVELDPAFVQSWLSLASVLADSGDMAGAREALGSGAAVAGAPPAVIENVRAKILLFEGELNEAAQAIDSALKAQRDARNLSLAVRIWIERGEEGLVPFGQAQAQVTALTRELDALGGLRNIYDYSVDFPRYFGSKSP